MKKVIWSPDWSKDKRRRMFLASKPKNWTKDHKYKECCKSLKLKAAKSKDTKTKILAKKDARYFEKKRG